MSWIGTVFRYAISFIACAALLWWIDWIVFIQTIELANWYWLVAVLAVILGDRAFMVYKWMILLRSSGVAVSWGMAFRAYFVGAFAEAFLPASIGGDVMRVTWLTYRIANSGKIISSVVVERLLGALALALVAVASFVLFARHLAGTSPELTVAIVTILSISLVGTVVIFSHRAHKAMKTLIAAIPFRGLGEMAEKARVAVLEFRGKPALLGIFLLLSICEQAFPIVANFMLAKAFSINLSLEWAAIGMPIIMAVARLPISVAGWGIQEGVYGLVFAYAGVPVTQSVMMALIGRVLVLLSAFPGAWWTISTSKQETLLPVIGRGTGL